MTTINDFVTGVIVAFKQTFPSNRAGQLSGTHCVCIAMHNGDITISGTLPEANVLEFVQLALGVRHRFERRGRPQ